MNCPKNPGVDFFGLCRPEFCFHFMNRSLLAIFTVGLFSLAAHADGVQAPKQQQPIREALLAAWKKVQAIDHPLLAGVSDVKPSFDEDAQGIRGASVTYVKNAVWPAKGDGPVPIDAQQPYLWVQVSVWRHDIPGQPSPATRGIRVAGADYNLEVRVLASDVTLSSRVESVLLGAFAPWQINNKNDGTQSPPSPIPPRK